MGDADRVRQHGLSDVLARTAAPRSQRAAIIWRGVTTTYGELDRTVNRIAHALGERGVRPGDRVAVLGQLPGIL